MHHPISGENSDGFEEPSYERWGENEPTTVAWGHTVRVTSFDFPNISCFANKISDQARPCQTGFRAVYVGSMSIYTAVDNVGFWAYFDR